MLLVLMYGIARMCSNHTKIRVTMGCFPTVLGSNHISASSALIYFQLLKMTSKRFLSRTPHISDNRYYEEVNGYQGNSHWVVTATSLYVCPVITKSRVTTVINSLDFPS